MITIVDYGLGNLGSIANMFKKIGFESIITSDIAQITDATKILLPGVGAFDSAMKRINDGGFREVLDQKALNDKIPVLGICLGMQLLTNSSEEGELKGLGWIQAETKKFEFDDNSLKVPHMGWNEVVSSNENPITSDLDKVSKFGKKPSFYFVHSYYVRVENEENSMLKTTYGKEFDAGIHKDNIYGVQFHPEKSHKFGMQLLSNFANL